MIGRLGEGEKVTHGELSYIPPGVHLPGAMREVIEWDSGKYLGQIRQAPVTYSVVGNMNQHQVAVGETTFGGREELAGSRLVDYGSLMFIALERATTAREAIQVIADVVAEYGYASTGESLSIADPNEAWILEIIGKGKDNPGAVWVARRVPDGYISAHANQARIRQFPLDDPANSLYSPDVISFAREKGYFEGPDASFSFADTYAPLTFGGLRFCPNGRSTVTADKTMYIDELKFPAALTGGTPLVFASGYASNNRTVEGGEWGFYSGNFTGYSSTAAGGGFVDDSPALPAADTYIFLVVSTSAPTTDGYMGIFTGAPGYTVAAPNAGVTLNGQTTLKIEIGMTPEWFKQPTNKALTVRLVGAQVHTDCSGGRCQILIDTPLTPTTADLLLIFSSSGFMGRLAPLEAGEQWVVENLLVRRAPPRGVAAAGHTVS